MNKEIIDIIKNDPYIYSFLREESYHYKYLYKDNSYINTIKKLAYQKYKQTNLDKVERLINNIKLIETFLSVIE
jgi:hypothetical protein